jgi:DNA topoisomerase IA
VWARGRLFDRDAATVFYEACAEAPTATVLEVRGARRLRHAPAPLSTLEFQKRGTQYLRLPGACVCLCLCFVCRGWDGAFNCRSLRALFARQ